MGVGWAVGNGEKARRGGEGGGNEKMTEVGEGDREEKMTEGGAMLDIIGTKRPLYNFGMIYVHVPIPN